jgi:hypothetical protein
MKINAYLDGTRVLMMDAVGCESVKWWRLGKSDAKKQQAGPLSSRRQRFSLVLLLYPIASIQFFSFYLIMPARLINLPAVVRCQVFEAYLSKRSFSISSKFSGHENPLVSSYSALNEHTQPV